MLLCKWLKSWFGPLQQHIAHKFGATAKTGEGTHWKMESYIIYMFIFNRNEWLVPTWTMYTHIHSHTQPRSLLISRWRSKFFCHYFHVFRHLARDFIQKFYAIAKEHTLLRVYIEYTLFTTSFYWFPSHVLWQPLRNYRAANVVGPECFLFGCCCSIWTFSLSSANEHIVVECALFSKKNFVSSIKRWEIVKVFCFCNKN